METGAPVRDVLEAARKSGRQLVRDGRMSLETLKTVSREFLPLDRYVGGLDWRFQQALDALEM